MDIPAYRSELSAPPSGIRRSRFPIILSVSALGWLVAALDFCLIAATSLGAAYLYHRIVLHSTISAERYVVIAAICFLNFAAIMVSRDGYSLARFLQPQRSVREVARVWVVVVLVTLGLLFAGKVGGDVSRGAVGLFFAAALVALVAWRTALARWTEAALASGMLARRPVLLLASRSELAHRDAVAALERAGLEPVDVFSWDARTSSEMLAAMLDEAVRSTGERAVHSVVVLANWSEPRVIGEIQQALGAVPNPVYLLPDHNVAHYRRVENSGELGLGASLLKRAPLSPSERAAKRAFDVTLATIGLLFLSPLLVVAGLAVKLDSPGPVLFRQTRNGFGGRPFKILKLRTMSVTEDGDAFRQARRNDPRVTRVGRFLRKTSIDELPQLWNVLTGDMSIVGPRPHPTALNKEYQQRIGAFAYRHHVKPGLTGWAQINGARGETASAGAMEKRIEHDLYYINHWTFSLDLRIVARTVQVVWGRDTAF